MKRIYLDHSATTPVDPKVLNEMMLYFSKKFGNASSLHNFGQEAIFGVDESRKKLASFLNCEIDEVYFTSGATESDNLAIFGTIDVFLKKGINPHVITLSIEHDAVLEPCMNLERRGVDVTYLSVEKNGVVDIEKVKKAIKENTVLISIMYVNSEVGSVQPIRDIGKLIKKINDKKENEWKKARTKDRGEKPQKIYFHTDATQAVNFFTCDTKYLHVDLLSMSGHKIYGPKGIGALFVKKETLINPIQLGGHHEKNIRSGTLNVAGIVGLGKAIEILSQEEIKKNNLKISKLRNFLASEVLKKIPNSILNTDRNNSTPVHAHFSFPGAEGESVLISLDLEGIAVSTGSACASGSLKGSHVLAAMGIKKEIAHTSIRMTLGKNNTKEEIKKVIKLLVPIVRRLRKMNPLY